MTKKPILIDQINSLPGGEIRAQMGRLHRTMEMLTSCIAANHTEGAVENVNALACFAEGLLKQLQDGGL